MIDPWDQVLQHFKDGMNASQVGAIQGMPSRKLIAKRLKTDPAFAAAVAPFYHATRGRKNFPQLSDEERKARKNVQNRARRDVGRVRPFAHRNQSARAASNSPRKRGPLVEIDAAMTARILAMLAKGAKLTAFAGRDGLPTYMAIWKKRQQDARFNQLITKAMPLRRRKRGGKGATWFSHEVWQEVARLWREGMSPDEIALMPGMPRPPSIYRRRLVDPNFATIAPPRSNQNGQEHFTAQTWDAVAIQLSLGRSIRSIGRMEGMPSPRSIRGALKRMPELAAINARRSKSKGGRKAGDRSKVASAPKITRKWEAVILRLAEGATPHQVSAIAGMPSFAEMERMIAENTEFAARVKHYWSGVKSARKASDLVTTIRRLLPRSLTPADRDDVMGDVMLALASNEASEADIRAQIAIAVKRRYAEADKHRLVSTETPVGDGWTLGEALGL